MSKQTKTQTRQMLETEVCSRCGGSGRHSYCQSWGTVCFRCQGVKRTLTKRGAAASKHLRQLRSKKLPDIRPGDSVRVDWPKVYWANVQAILPQAEGGFTMECEGIRFAGLTSDSVFRVRQSREEATETLRQALEYQDSLTKQGKPRRR